MRVLALACALALGAALGCASGSPEPESPHSFQRDRERCWEQTIRDVRFDCPDGPCSVTFPTRVEFATCMQQRGWETVDPLDLDGEPGHRGRTAPGAAE